MASTRRIALATLAAILVIFSLIPALLPGRAGAIAPTIPVIVKTAGSGTVTASPPGTNGLYDPNTQVTFTANQASGWLFIGWTVVTMDRTQASPIVTSQHGWKNPLVLTIVRETNIVANFVREPSFPDVNTGTPYYNAINQLAARGIFRGDGSGMLLPNNTVQRSEMAATLNRTVGWSMEDWNEPLLCTSTNPDQVFCDIGTLHPDTQRQIRVIAHYRVSLGTGNGNFDPASSVTKAQMTTFIVRAMSKHLALTKYNCWWTQQADNPSYYNNPSGILQSAHHRDMVTYYLYAGLIPGTTNNTTFSGYNDNATRAWIAGAEWQAINSYFGLYLVDTYPAGC
jgi:hypothetical protein